MILAFDTAYSGDRAKTVCIAFHDWSDQVPTSIHSETIDGVADYEPGQFYKRELPCILSLLKSIPFDDVEVIIVDGFVVLDDTGLPGLGAHLHAALAGRVPVIGVAKTNFATLHQLKAEVLRGKSKKPLYVTAMGMLLERAADRVRTMHGEFRMPHLLSELDRLTKTPHL
ncbi:MAG: endonuclease V [Flavobacteriales bacterium]|nr:endonuclease V [Flavobacteriales bacterium]